MPSTTLLQSSSNTTYSIIQVQWPIGCLADVSPGSASLGSGSPAFQDDFALIYELPLVALSHHLNKAAPVPHIQCLTLATWF